MSLISQSGDLSLEDIYVQQDDKIKEILKFYNHPTQNHLDDRLSATIFLYERILYEDKKYVRDANFVRLYQMSDENLRQLISDRGVRYPWEVLEGAIEPPIGEVNHFYMIRLLINSTLIDPVVVCLKGQGTKNEEGVRIPTIDNLLYIGRNFNMGGWKFKQSKWFNPYTRALFKDIPDRDKRAAIMTAYGNYITNKGDINTVKKGGIPNLLEDIHELAGFNLGCWCVPEPCHGTTLLDLFKLWRPTGPIELF